MYYDIIRQKTASLIASACAVGYASAHPNADAETQKLVWEMGEKIGIAFQIRDDLFDFGNEQTGKPKGIDIKEKKVTLPLIYALQHAPERERKYIIRLIKKHHAEPKRVAEVIDFVWQSGGIAYATTAMHHYRQQAADLLHQFPDTPARQALEELIWFVTERER